MKQYAEIGHKYVCDYSLNPSLTWVLTTSPIMTEILGGAEFAEVDATFRSSIELEYLLNVVCFHFSVSLPLDVHLQCILYNMYYRDGCGSCKDGQIGCTSL